MSFISEFTDLTEDERRNISDNPLVNVLDYDHELEHWFTPEQMRLMYSNNPLWASLEERLYGDLMLLD
jgi:hypothetical protein